MISASKFVMVQLSRIMTGSSTPNIIIRERHAFFSLYSILYSFDCFFSDFLPTPAWIVSIGSAVIAESCGVFSALLVKVR